MDDFRAGTEVRGFLYRHDGPARVIGNLALSQIVRGALHACTLGYSLAGDAQGRGYMLEAVRGAVAYAFGPLACTACGRLHASEPAERIRAPAGGVRRGRLRARLLAHQWPLGGPHLDRDRQRRLSR